MVSKLILRLLNRISKRAFVEGFLRKDAMWAVLAVAAFLFKRFLSYDSSKVVFSKTLNKGEGVEIINLGRQK